MPEKLTFLSGLNQGDTQWEPVPLLTKLRSCVYRTNGHSERKPAKLLPLQKLTQLSSPDRMVSENKYTVPRNTMKTL